MKPAARAQNGSRTSWAPEQVGDLSGVSVIVTGANSGLGLETSIELAAHGATVVLACRDEARGERALDRLAGAVPGARAELRPLDLADLASVRRFAAVWADRRLDVLINNAGVMATPYRTTPDGFELQLATNHLGHFALTGLLLPVMLATGDLLGGPPRVVSVSSTMHRLGRLSRDDLMLENTYAPWPAYSRSKLANLLFMRELQRRASQAGVALLSLAAHPGYAATGIQTAGPALAGPTLLSRVMGAATRVLAQPAAQGAWPTLRAATDPQAQGGEFFGPSRLGEMSGPPRRVGMSSAARDPRLASWLWERSAELTGVTYTSL